MPPHALLLVAAAALALATGTPSPPLLLRVRTPAGAIVRATAGADETIGDVAARATGCPSCEPLFLDAAASGEPVDLSATAATLGLARGGLLYTRPKAVERSAAAAAPAGAATAASAEPAYMPFPALARKKRAAQPTAGSSRVRDMSDLGDVWRLSKPPPSRCQACSIATDAANDFRDAVVGDGASGARCGLLLGTVKPAGADEGGGGGRSSSLHEMGQGEKTKGAVRIAVEAVCDAPGATPSVYDRAAAADASGALAKLGGALGLVPVGWAFSYGQARPFAVSARDAYCGAALQLKAMQTGGRAKGQTFVMIAVCGDDGSFEAFTMTDAAVQMLAEGVLAEPPAPREGAPFTKALRATEPVASGGAPSRKIETEWLVKPVAIEQHAGWLRSGLGRAGSKAALKALLFGDKKGGKRVGNKAVLKKLADVRALAALLDLGAKPRDVHQMAAAAAEGAAAAGTKKKKAPALADAHRAVLEKLLGVVPGGTAAAAGQPDFVEEGQEGDDLRGSY